MRILKCVCFYSGQGAKLSAPAHAPYLRPVGNDTHGRSLQRGAPTVGALGDAAMDENGRAINRHFQVSRIYSPFSYKFVFKWKDGAYWLILLKCI